MRRILLALIGLSALALVVQRACVALASEETKIRWRLERMERGFNEAQLAACLKGIADDWRHADSGLGRAELADALRATFMQEIDPESRAFRYRVALDRETLAIELEPGREDRARVQLELAFEILERGAWTPTWRARVEAELARDEELGWRAEQSRHATLASDGRLVREVPP